MEKLKDAICDLVSIAEEHLKREDFEELDNAGATIIGYLDELETMKNHLQERERMLHDLMNNLSEDTEMYKETRAKHVELLHILDQLKIETIE